VNVLPSVTTRQSLPYAMSNPNTIRINTRYSVPTAELEFKASRSGGPGGQHANTSATRIQLFWNVREAQSLSDRRRQLILSRLSSRIDGDGVLQVACDTHRSQHQNRQEATERFAELVAEALRPNKKRKRTRPTRASKERRLKNKKHRGKVKKLRGRVRRDE
jgi:ribosome-associated protein